MPTYDYIVIGSGSAGAVVAGRLTEDPSVRVLLVEAGGSHRHPSVQIPAAFATQFKSKRDWEYYTEPEAHLDGRSLYYPRGKMLGGSSGMNAMIYIRGNRADYDGWAKAGATGWSYDEVLPLFRRTETNSRGASEYHGADGPLHVEDLRSPTQLSFAMVEAMVEAGLPRNPDFNGADQTGAGWLQNTLDRGQRCTTADAFLVPARDRANLTILTQTRALRVQIEDGRAVGVELEHDGQRRLARAEREVVLSGGAINTPQLLMLSGIGPADHLTEHGIVTEVDNPHVGAHLMDHPFYVVNYETTMKGTLFEAKRPLHLIDYLVRRRGLLTSNVGETGAFFATREGLEAPDMQIIGAPGYFWDNGFSTHDRPAFAHGLSLVAPSSEGSVRLRSADPRDPAALSLNLLSNDDEVEAMLTGIERSRDIVTSPSHRTIVTRELHPGAAARTRAELVRELRRGTQHTFHVTSSARMGVEGEGVVDAELRVYGVEGLRVADASVFPRITRGNTHAPSMMVGEKAADLLRSRG